MDLERVRRVVNSLGFNVSHVRFFSGFKSAEVQALSVCKANPRLEFSLAQSNAHQAGNVVGPSLLPVLRVPLIGYIAQVLNSVVRPFAVDMVDDAARPFSMNVKPSKSMRLPVFPHEPDASVAFATCMPGNLPGLRKPASAFAPRKNASFGIIMQQLFQECLHFYIVGFSHVIAPFQRRFGQRIEGADNAFFPRLNIRGIA